MRAAIVVVCIMCASTASAQGIGREWLEKMSGPDLGGIEVRIPIVCRWQKPYVEEKMVGDEKVEISYRQVWYWQTRRTETVRTMTRGTDKKSDNQRVFCIDAAFGSFNNDDREDLAFHASGQRFEGAFTWRLDQYKEWLRFIEPSIAIGGIGFLTDNHREWRLDISGRIAIRPLDLFPCLRKDRWGSVIQVTFRPELILPGITDEDLGADPAESFEHRFRFGGSWRDRPFFIVDFSELLGLR
jgi:hypothetical protein